MKPIPQRPMYDRQACADRGNPGAVAVASSSLARAVGGVRKNSLDRARQSEVRRVRRQPACRSNSAGSLIASVTNLCHALWSTSHQLQNELSGRSPQRGLAESVQAASEAMNAFRDHLQGSDAGQLRSEMTSFSRRSPRYFLEECLTGQLFLTRLLEASLTMAPEAGPQVSNSPCPGTPPPQRLRRAA
jgi:hypothetical protein